VRTSLKDVHTGGWFQGVAEKSHGTVGVVVRTTDGRNVTYVVSRYPTVDIENSQQEKEPVEHK
jgi:hypothetical protein